MLLAEKDEEAAAKSARAVSWRRGRRSAAKSEQESGVHLVEELASQPLLSGFVPEDRFGQFSDEEAEALEYRPPLVAARVLEECGVRSVLGPKVRFYDARSMPVVAPEATFFGMPATYFGVIGGVFGGLAIGVAVAIPVGCATLALFIPVRRATRVDPVVALRVE